MNVLGRLRQRVVRPSAADFDAYLAKSTYLLGGLPVPLQMAESDVVISGGKQTGKTTAMIAQMCSHVDAMLASGQHFNMHAFTTKPDDFYPLLKWLYEPLGIKVVATNPMMEESWSWDGAGTLKDPVRIDELVNVVVKKEAHDASPFFKNAARLVIRSVIQSLAATHPGLWTMRHVVNCLKSVELTAQVLGRYAPTRDFASLLAEDQGVAGANLRTTILLEVAALELVASLIDGTLDDRRFSVEEAAHEPGIIWVWGADPRFDTLIQPWNAVQLELIGHEWLVRGDVGVETLLYLDEFPQLSAGGGQKLSIITKILEFGRSSRVRTTLAVQTPAQVVTVYGEEADTLLGQCHCFQIFKHSDAFGRKYWAERLGRERGFEKKRGYSRQTGGSYTGGKNPSRTSSWSETENVNVERFDLERVTPSDIGDLPVGNYRGGMYGFASIPLSRRLDPATGVPKPLTWRFHLAPDWIARHVPKPGEFRPYARSLKPAEAFTLPPLHDWEYGFLELTRPEEGRR